MSNKTLPFLSYLSLVVLTEPENQCKKKGDKRIDGKEGDAKGRWNFYTMRDEAQSARAVVSSERS